MNLSWLKSNWFSLLAELNVDRSLGNEVFADLIQTYYSPNRHHHNLHHIQHLLSLSKSIAEKSDRLSVIQLSAWFHDYIYDSKAKDNEIKSAIYAAETLIQLNIPPDIIQSVKQIILSTQKHQPLIDSVDNLIFLDLDLAILGTKPNSYLKYAQAIRQEYSWLGDRDYQRGRKQVLTSFLARERIYYTDYFYQKLELTARENLVAEIELYV
jgi:predicted metal-dependent HD superfamily phosphohydrolase